MIEYIESEYFSQWLQGHTGGHIKIVFTMTRQGETHTTVYAMNQSHMLPLNWEQT